MGKTEENKGSIIHFRTGNPNQVPSISNVGDLWARFDIKVLGNNFLWHFARNISHCLEQYFCNEFSHLLIPTQVLIALRTNKSPFRAIKDNMLLDLLPTPSHAVAIFFTATQTIFWVILFTYFLALGQCRPMCSWFI